MKKASADLAVASIHCRKMVLSRILDDDALGGVANIMALLHQPLSNVLPMKRLSIWVINENRIDRSQGPCFLIWLMLFLAFGFAIRRFITPWKGGHCEIAHQYPCFGRWR